jgi:hypothetical protein
VQSRWKIWCLLRDQLAHVKPVETALGESAEFYYDEEWNPARLTREQPHLVLCVNDYHYDVVRCLDAARQADIPSLTLQDGILEWRCQYDNPLFVAGGGAAQHQPVMADKIACLGNQSARQIAAWGNAGKVEVTGMPRLDHLLHRAEAPMRRPGSRILIMTAKNPGFTPEQREVTLQSLRDVKKYLEAVPGVTLLWRVSGNVASALHVENRMNKTSSVELADVVEQADAVITTPSTAMLEAMRLERPVAALDYHNVPRFVPTAWTISAPDHIRDVVAELLDPPAIKMVFQGDCLADCLYGYDPAAERVAWLIRKMIDLKCNGNGLLPDILNSDLDISTTPPPAIKSRHTAPSAFDETDVRALQARLARADNENGRLKAQIAAQRLPSRIAGKMRHWVGGN